jgi:uncharacterized protein (DUF952 family)
MPAEPVFHIARRAEWEAQAPADYVPAAFATEGFIHLSFRSQVLRSANKHFAHERDLLLLELDPTQFPQPFVAENTSGGTDVYPHLYCHLPRVAVLRQWALSSNADGSFALPADF